MHRVALLVLLSSAVTGCLIDRSALGAGDARVDPGLDASADASRSPDANRDAWLDPSLDAWAPDAYVEPPDAWAPDAWGADAWAPDAWMPDAGRPDASTCAGPLCTGNELVACDGSRTSCFACGVSPMNPAPHCLDLIPSNVGTLDVTARADGVTVDGETVEWNTGNCDSGHTPATGGNVPGAQVHRVSAGGVDVCVVRASTLRVINGGMIVAVGSRPLIVFALDEIFVDATSTISVASRNDESSTTCAADIVGAGSMPAHPGADGAAGTDTYSPDGGGGGGGFCGAGGAGGNGSGGGSGGLAGVVRPSLSLVPMVGGARGGNGSGPTGEGGHGGGALQLSAGRVRIDGAILAHGAGGLGGGTGGGRRAGGGGGGGSGGGVHLEALQLQLGAGSVIDLRGGGGGAAGCWNGSSDVSGECAPHTAAPAGMAGATIMCGGATGGDGASGTSISGTAGDADYNAPGGGGGAGCLVLRTMGTPAPVTAPMSSSIVTRMAPAVR